MGENPGDWGRERPMHDWGRERPMHDWGISDGYHDVAGRWRSVPPETLAAVRAAMGAPDAGDAAGGGRDGNGQGPPGTAPGDDPVVTYRPGPAPQGLTDGGPWEL